MIHTIKLSLESILSQIDNNFEVLVVDNCSTDGTREYLEKLARKGKIRLIVAKCNRGEGRQIALENASAEFVIARLDVDTIYNRVILPIAELYLQKRKQLGKDFVLHAGALFVSSKKHLLKLGGWRDLQWGENYELNKRLIDKGEVYLCRIEEAKYHIKPSRRNFLERLKISFYVYRDSLRMGLKASTVVRGTFYLVSNPLKALIRCFFLILIAFPASLMKKRYDTFKNTDWLEYYVLECYGDQLKHFEIFHPDKVIPVPESLCFPKMKYVFVEVRQR